MHQHCQIVRRERGGQLQERVASAAAEQRTIIIGRRQCGGKENGGLAPFESLSQQVRGIETKQLYPYRAVRLNEGYITFIIQFSGAAERVQLEIKLQQAFPKFRRFIPREPGLSLL